MRLSFETPPAYDLGADANLGMWLTEWGEYADRIVHLGPDDGRSHGQLCWDVLAPTGLLMPHCGHCKPQARGPRSPQQMESALRMRIPPHEVSRWTAATLIRTLAYTNGVPDGPMRPVADAIGDGLAVLLGPDADWRANGYAAYREGAHGNVSWTPLTEATFDAAVVGIGEGHAVVIVATDED
ncbi:hypothetical protein AQI88_39450 [Streptomyces cellostaticus]|uniref:Uncharacterized protein n=1 Tax=Streptomyces cellostaticus TaxID=67285 RepID=A0A101NAV0_9ACTN|nr:hypothetical protein [Streptomyces cellostaticus]KUM89739.1 hypothetical protein AQI88_39450 [Streptomyces cellostaticus]